MRQITMDVQSPEIMPALKVKQNDSLSRFFELTLLDGGAAYSVPAGATLTVRYEVIAFDGTHYSGWYDTITLEDQTTRAAVVQNNNVLTVELASNACAGSGWVCVMINDSNGYQLSSWNLKIDCQEVPAEDSQQTQNYYNVLATLLANCTQATQDANNAATAANNASTAANNAAAAATAAAGQIPALLNSHVYTLSAESATYAVDDVVFKLSDEMNDRLLLHIMNKLTLISDVSAEVNGTTYTGLYIDTIIAGRKYNFDDTGTLTTLYEYDHNTGEITAQVAGTYEATLVLTGSVINSLLIPEYTETQNRLAMLESFHKDDLTFADIKAMTDLGIADKYLSVGDEIDINWTDPDGGTTYAWTHVVMAIRDTVIYKNGAEVTKQGVILYPKYTSPFGIQFSNYQAFYYAENGLQAGTYNVIMGYNWGTYVIKDDVWQFTLTQDVPAGGQLCGFYNCGSTDISTLKVYSYASSTDTTPIETVDITSGSAGTNLGTFLATVNGNLNSLQRVSYGDNTYKRSAVRQYGNGTGTGWWTPQSVWDRPPAEVSKHGYMDGFSSDVLDYVATVRVKTALNTVTEDGSLDVTYDKFFLAGLEELYFVPQLSGEGDYWPYWKTVTGSNSPNATGSGGQNNAYITYAINAKTTAQYVWLRSSYRGNAYFPWILGTSGYATYGGNARTSLRVSFGLCIA